MPMNACAESEVWKVSCSSGQRRRFEGEGFSSNKRVQQLSPTLLGRQLTPAAMHPAISRPYTLCCSRGVAVAAGKAPGTGADAFERSWLLLPCPDTRITFCRIHSCSHAADGSVCQAQCHRRVAHLERNTCPCQGAWGGVVQACPVCRLLIRD